MEKAKSHTHHTVSAVGSNTGVGPASQEKAASDAGGGEDRVQSGADSVDLLPSAGAGGEFLFGGKATSTFVSVPLRRQESRDKGTEGNVQAGLSRD